MSRVANKEPIEAAVDEKIDSLAKNGYRALGVARTVFKKKLAVCGLNSALRPS
jgi:magnesium-transporting ATPase (P-type)